MLMTGVLHSQNKTSHPEDTGSQTPENQLVPETRTRTKPNGRYIEEYEDIAETSCSLITQMGHNLDVGAEEKHCKRV